MDFEIEEYTHEMGEIIWQKGYSNELQGLSIEEQLRCYALTTSLDLVKLPYDQIESKCKENNSYIKKIEKVESDGVLVKDGLIVGIKRMKTFKMNSKREFTYYYEYIKPYERFCYFISDDNNGSGYKETKWYKHLICLPANHKLW